MNEVDWWRGEHGDEYTVRNADADISARQDMWHDISRCLPTQPRSILEVGAGSGNNLKALRKFFPSSVNLLAIEPNASARITLINNGFTASGGDAANPSCWGDLAFTSGVLIHIPPNELLAACQGIHDAAERYIVAIEYFSAEPEEIPYRGRKLWKRDFGSYWLDNFDLKVLGNGFAWKRTTGLDNLTWWAFEKCS